MIIIISDCGYSTVQRREVDFLHCVTAIQTVIIIISPSPATFCNSDNIAILYIAIYFCKSIYIAFIHSFRSQILFFSPKIVRSGRQKY